MSNVLFINACIRKGASRTLSLCHEYLSRFDKKEVSEVNLESLNLLPFSAELLAKRDALQQEQAWSDPLFDLANQLTQADEVVIGTPYWDLSFPSILKVYLEHICVCGITFHYTEEGRPEGLCRAKSTTYITTSGGFIADKNYGYDYVCGVADMLNLGTTRFVAAEGLDIIGMDIEAQMNKAHTAIKAL